MLTFNDKKEALIDCGLFAIAAATDLCNGQDPCHRQYRQDEMRGHLLSCLKNQHLTPFPASERTVWKKVYETTNVPLYCICRLPNNGEEKMVECGKCKEWFHKTCLSVPRDVFDKTEASWDWCCNSRKPLIFMRNILCDWSVCLSYRPFIRLST